jgi:hypothetical protein
MKNPIDGGFPVQGVRFGVLKSVPFGLTEAPSLRGCGCGVWRYVVYHIIGVPTRTKNEKAGCGGAYWLVNRTSQCHRVSPLWPCTCSALGPQEPPTPHPTPSPNHLRQPVTSDQVAPPGPPRAGLSPPPRPRGRLLPITLPHTRPLIAQLITGFICPRPAGWWWCRLALCLALGFPRQHSSVQHLPVQRPLAQRHLSVAVLPFQASEEGCCSEGFCQTAAGAVSAWQWHFPTCNHKEQET